MSIESAFSKFGDGARCHQVRLAGRGAHAEQREPPGTLESVAQLELAEGHVVEAAEVDVVAARGEACLHRVEVDPV